MYNMYMYYNHVHLLNLFMQSLEPKHRKNFSLLPLSELKEYDKVLTSELKHENYKQKFHILLYYEEHEHARILSERYVCMYLCMYVCMYVCMYSNIIFVF